MNAHLTTTEHLKDTSLKLSIAPSLEGDNDLAKSCLKTAAADDLERDPGDMRQTKTCYQQGHPVLDSKPRIWSLAQTATSLNQTEYPSCMLRCQPAMPSSPEASSPTTGLDRQQDSPVTTLRNWVDGVFHDPLFRHSTLNQSHTNTSVSWTTTKGSILETGAPEHMAGSNGIKGHTIALQHQESNKDNMAFPKVMNKMFCS